MADHYYWIEGSRCAKWVCCGESRESHLIGPGVDPFMFAEDAP